jgi:hypothetical protein
MSSSEPLHVRPVEMLCPGMGEAATHRSGCPVRTKGLPTLNGDLHNQDRCECSALDLY